MDHPPVKSGTLFEKDLISRVITQGVFVAAMTIAAYWIGADLSGHQTGQTMAFCVLAFSQMLRAFNQRSNTQPIWVRAEGHNPWLILSFRSIIDTDDVPAPDSGPSGHIPPYFPVCAAVGCRADTLLSIYSSDGNSKAV